MGETVNEVLWQIEEKYYSDTTWTLYFQNRTQTTFRGQQFQILKNIIYVECDVGLIKTIPHSRIVGGQWPCDHTT